MLLNNKYCYRVFNTKLFHSKIQNGPTSLHCQYSNGASNQMCNLGTKLFHCTLLIQNGSPKGPPTFYFHNSKRTSKCFIWAPNYTKLISSFKMDIKGQTALYRLEHQKDRKLFIFHNSKGTSKLFILEPNYSIVPPKVEMDHQKDHQFFIVIKEKGPQTKYIT